MDNLNLKGSTFFMHPVELQHLINTTFCCVKALS